eukprot:g60349.t1
MLTFQAQASQKPEGRVLRQLASLLGQGRFPCLRELHLEGNPLGDAGLDCLVDSLVHHRSPLQILGLARTTLSRPFAVHAVGL